MAGEGGGQLLRGGDVAGAGIGEAAVDPGQLGFGGDVFAGGEGGFDLGRIGGEFGLGLGGPGGGAGQGVGEGPVRARMIPYLRRSSDGCLLRSRDRGI